MYKAKLELQKRTDQQIIDLLYLIQNEMAGKPMFPAPNPPLTALDATSVSLLDLIQQRAMALQQAQTLTLQIRDKRNEAEEQIGTEAAYVEKIANPLPPAAPLDPAAAAAVFTSAGMEMAGGSSPVGPMPKVEGLTATQGDSSGELDMNWNPVKRGLHNYTIETTLDPAGLTGWAFAAIAPKSKHTLTGIAPGTRVWMRVAANGTAGTGPWSDPATKVAP